MVFGYVEVHIEVASHARHVNNILWSEIFIQAMAPIVLNCLSMCKLNMLSRVRGLQDRRNF